MNAVCEYCHRESADPRADGWELTWQSWLCPECIARAQRDHGAGWLFVTRGGEYAEGRLDPRAEKEHAQ